MSRHPFDVASTPHETADKFDIPRWKVVGMLVSVKHDPDIEVRLKPIPMDPAAEGVVP